MERGLFLHRICASAPALTDSHKLADSSEEEVRASDVLNEGYITYSNEAKIRLVNVSPETLERYGAVSFQTAKEMANGAAKAAKAEAALSATGIAGPGGGTEEKPVGLVYIGCSVNGKTTAKRCVFDGNRMENRQHTVETALEMLVEALENLEK